MLWIPPTRSTAASFGQSKNTSSSIMNENEIPEDTDLERAQAVQDGRKVDNTCKAYMYRWRKFVYWATEKLRLNEINLLNNEEMTREGIDNFGGVNLDLIMPEHFIEFFGYIMIKRDKNTMEPLEPVQQQSYSNVAGYHSAIQHAYNVKQKTPSESIKTERKRNQKHEHRRKRCTL